MRWYTLSLEREERSNEVKIWFATRSAIDDAHTTVARLFGLFVNVRRHRRRFEVARHVVHVARRGRVFRDALAALRGRRAEPPRSDAGADVHSRRARRVGRQWCARRRSLIESRTRFSLHFSARLARATTCTNAFPTFATIIDSGGVCVSPRRERYA